jgi:putative Mg2+ transporter-C (MgtC) family protein
LSAQAQLEALLPVVVAMALTGLIGLDREWRHSPAGLRTHMLVGMGAALIMSVATRMYDPDTAARMAANVITGIGFLGAGTIIRRGAEVHELTTAASLWFVAMIGLAAGAELYVMAGGATVLGVLALTGLRWLTKRARAQEARSLTNTHDGASE